MKILGIETSCDETALSLITAGLKDNDPNKPTFEKLGTAIYSQIEEHKEYGGVYPMVAKREHSKKLIPLLDDLLQKTNHKTENSDQKDIAEYEEQIREILSREPELAEQFLKIIPKIKKPDIDLIAVTYGPGLEPALWVGINFARALSLAWQIPLMPVNHMEGHIVSVLNTALNTAKTKDEKHQEIEFPAIALLISGGHTEIVLVNNFGGEDNSYQILGKTKDDAVGEAFDKVARILGLEYPGGPKISALAEKARKNDSAENSSDNKEISLPRPMINSGDYNFSFSGLKTAVLYLVKDLNKDGKNLDEKTKQIIAKEFEEVVTEVLIKKTLKAIHEHNAKSLIIGGGVIANKFIREEFSKALSSENVSIFIPEMELTTDNGLMIAMAGFLNSIHQKPEINPSIKAEGNLEL